MRHSDLTIIASPTKVNGKYISTTFHMCTPSSGEWKVSLFPNPEEFCSSQRKENSVSGKDQNLDKYFWKLLVCGKREQLRLQEPHLWRASPEQLLAELPLVHSWHFFNESNSCWHWPRGTGRLLTNRPGSSQVPFHTIHIAADVHLCLGNPGRTGWKYFIRLPLWDSRCARGCKGSQWLFALTAVSCSAQVSCIWTLRGQRANYMAGTGLNIRGKTQSRNRILQWDAYCKNTTPSCPREQGCIQTPSILGLPACSSMAPKGYNWQLRQNSFWTASNPDLQISDISSVSCSNRQLLSPLNIGSSFLVYQAQSQSALTLLGLPHSHPRPRCEC